MTEQQQAIRIGADPEVFVRKAGGDVVPVCGLIGGTKETPKPLPHKEEYYPNGTVGQFAVQEDGVAMEFNIPAFTTASAFSLGISYAMKECGRMARARSLELVPIPFHTFKADQLSDDRANTIGCSPDLDAYNDGAPRPSFSIKDFGADRFAGGHIHLGYNIEKVEPKYIARYMDLYIGLPSIFLDKQGPRRKYYGQAGLFRQKPYGIEYRTLSNYWIQARYHSEYLIYLAQTALDLGALANNRPEILSNAYADVPWQDIKTAIETENTSLAQEIQSYATSVLRLPMRYWRELSLPRSTYQKTEPQVRGRRAATQIFDNGAVGRSTGT